MESFDPGRRFGVYEIVRPLGQGGMGHVYEVVHTGLGARYALKVFTVDGACRDFLKKRFLVEGKLLSELRHERIVRVTDLAVDGETGIPYFVMDLVLSPDGTPRSLADEQKSGSCGEENVERWMRDICEGLAYVHSKGVVHRDISLENVLIGPDGRAVITDFGISMVADNRLRRRVELTRYTMVELGNEKIKMGKSGYLAPELLRSVPAKATPETDAWAFGVLLFRLLTGFWFEPTRAENSFEMLELCTLDWRPVFGRLLSSNPSDRLPPEGIAGVPSLLVKRRAGRLKVSSGPLVGIAVAVAAAALVAAAVWFAYGRGSSEDAGGRGRNRRTVYMKTLSSDTDGPHIKYKRSAIQEKEGSAEKRK